jgi:flagellar L-ring protein FlgH
MSGVCRAEDVGVDNSVLSTQLANLSLSKQTAGEVRDGVKRGWMNKILDEVNPF